MRLASFFTSSMDLTTLTPPPLPRPPAWICAFTTQTGPGSSLRRRHGFFHREGGLAAGHRRAEAAQDLFGLIFVNVHGWDSLIWPGEIGAERGRTRLPMQGSTIVWRKVRDTKTQIPNRAGHMPVTAARIRPATDATSALPMRSFLPSRRYWLGRVASGRNPGRIRGDGSRLCRTGRWQRGCFLESRYCPLPMTAADEMGSGQKTRAHIPGRTSSSRRAFEARIVTMAARASRQ